MQIESYDWLIVQSFVSIVTIMLWSEVKNWKLNRFGDLALRYHQDFVQAELFGNKKIWLKVLDDLRLKECMKLRGKKPDTVDHIPIYFLS